MNSGRNSAVQSGGAAGEPQAAQPVTGGGRGDAHQRPKPPVGVSVGPAALAPPVLLEQLGCTAESAQVYC
jgi:hypothetical protein